MATAALFLRSICETPDDDAVRGIFADQLDEWGQPERAAFIRLQIQMARDVIPDGGSAYFWDGIDRHRECGCPFCEMRRRERQLLCNHFDAWHSLPRDEHGLVWDMMNFDDDEPEPERQWGALFRRGFVASISLPCAAFLTHAEAIFRAAPVTEVRLVDREPYNYRTYDQNPLDGPGDWAWWYSRRPRENRRPGARGIPEAIWLRLESDRIVNHWKHYTSPDAALSALSRACVAYGRSLAGLPALPRGTPAQPAPRDEHPWAPGTPGSSYRRCEECGHERLCRQAERMQPFDWEAGNPDDPMPTLQFDPPIWICGSCYTAANEPAVLVPRQTAPERRA